MPERIRAAGSWLAVITLALVGGWVASWGFYEATIDRRIKLAEVERQTQAERVAADERENERKHNASLADRNLSKQEIKTNRADIDGLLRDVAALKAEVAALKSGKVTLQP